VKETGGINTVPDLKGKRVSMGSAGSGTEIIANRTLEAYGLDPAADISRERLGAQDSANALRDGKIDAFFFSGGLPVPAVLDLATGTKIKMLDLADSISKMSAKYGNFYFPIKIPKSTYNTAADVTVSGVANLRVVPSSFDPALARAILATMFDNKADLEAVRPEAKDLTLASVHGRLADRLPSRRDRLLQARRGRGTSDVRALLAPLLFVLILTGAALAAPVPVLAVGSADSSVALPLADGEPFTSSYVQSIYNAPVVEDLMRHGDAVRLLRVRSTRSPGRGILPLGRRHPERGRLVRRGSSAV